MAIKRYDTFLDENLSGEYCYYGPGSLLPIVTKLASEGKSPSMVYDFLTSLGVDEQRKRLVISKAFPAAAVAESRIFEDDIDDLVSADADEDPSSHKKDKDKEDDSEEEDDEDDEDEEDEDEEDEEGEDDSDETKVLKRVLADQQKLDKIRSILKECHGLEVPQGAPVEFVRELERLVCESVKMGGEDEPYQLFYWNRNDREGSFLSAGSAVKEDLMHMVKLLGISEYYVCRRGFKNLTPEGGGPEHLDCWVGPDDAFVSSWDGAAAKRITNP